MAIQFLVNEKIFYVLIQVWEDKTDKTSLYNKYRANHLHMIFGWFIEFRPA